MQLPLNAVASPIAEAGLVEGAKAQNIAVFARSVFLQGVLLMPPERIPSYLAALVPVVERLRALAAAEGISLAGLLMDAVARIDGVYSLVIGADSPSQVEELAGYARAQERGIALPDDLRVLVRGLSTHVTDPRQWAQAERETAGV
jgi:aryl-alcohol dehydrogenase-like predicted oxidoreductase